MIHLQMQKRAGDFGKRSFSYRWEFGEEPNDFDFSSVMAFQDCSFF